MKIVDHIKAMAILGAAKKSDIVKKDYDVIVVGATETGVAAAVKAARLGLTVLLVSNSERIGGMTGWGINQTDVNEKKSPYMISGLAQEYYTKIATSETADATFQRWHRQNGRGLPSWYSRAFSEMVGVEKIDYLYNANIDSVTKTGTRIVSAVFKTTVSPLTAFAYTAKVWIECTDTGDVVQKAGLSLSVGREATTLYGETFAGVKALSAWTNSAVIDPYVTPGVAGSGLLPTIDPAPLGTVGSGDGRCMEMAYRIFLTSVPAERIAVPAPDMSKYNPLYYELLGRAMAVQPTYYGDATLGLTRIFQFYDLAQSGGTAMGPTFISYVDLNSLGGCSLNYPITAENTEYVTATTARRAVIAENAKQWFLGLWYWLTQSSDSRIPAVIRTAMGNYGLSSKQLQAYGGLSPQLYVREGARVVGDFVLSAAGAILQNAYNDPIAYAYYDFDSHWVRRINNAGQAALEGAVLQALGQQAGFAIPYRALLPKVAECTNLLCPNAPSVSQYVWLTVRMAPVLMAMGEAAAIGAYLAIKGNTTVQAVDTARLVRMQNLMKTWNAIVLSVDGIYSRGTVTKSGGGTGLVATSNRFGYVGTSYQQTPTATANTLSFAPLLSRSGMYRVQICYAPADTTAAGDQGRATNLPVTINHADGVATRTVNQLYTATGVNGFGGVWEDLGAFYFRSNGLSASVDNVSFDFSAVNGPANISAVKWVPLN